MVLTGYTLSQGPLDEARHTHQSDDAQRPRSNQCLPNHASPYRPNNSRVSASRGRARAKSSEGVGSQASPLQSSLPHARPFSPLSKRLSTASAQRQLPAQDREGTTLTLPEQTALTSPSGGAVSPAMARPQRVKATKNSAWSQPAHPVRSWRPQGGRGHVPTSQLSTGSPSRHPLTLILDSVMGEGGTWSPPCTAQGNEHISLSQIYLEALSYAHVSPVPASYRRSGKDRVSQRQNKAPPQLLHRRLRACLPASQGACPRVPQLPYASQVR